MASEDEDQTKKMLEELTFEQLNHMVTATRRLLLSITKEGERRGLHVRISDQGTGARARYHDRVHITDRKYEFVTEKTRYYADAAYRRKLRAEKGAVEWKDPPVDMNGGW